MVTISTRSLVPGHAGGPVVCLDQPLSFWGGFDAESGTIVDERHPQRGTELTGSIVVMSAGRGSSSASSVLAEAIRLGTAPAGVVMGDDDEIIALGAIVAEELYGTVMPVVVVDPVDYATVAAARQLRISPDEVVVVE